jgi:hypothetical protein
MAELAVTDGMPPPADLPAGELIVHRVKDSLWIAHADPRILISAELLDAIADGDCGPAWLDGALLTIHGVNRTVIYCITDYLPRIHGYIAEWPD